MRGVQRGLSKQPAGILYIIIIAYHVMSREQRIYENYPDGPTPQCVYKQTPLPTEEATCVHRGFQKERNGKTTSVPCCTWYDNSDFGVPWRSNPSFSAQKSSLYPLVASALLTAAPLLDEAFSPLPYPIVGSAAPK